MLATKFKTYYTCNNDKCNHRSRVYYSYPSSWGADMFGDNGCCPQCGEIGYKKVVSRWISDAMLSDAFTWFNGHWEDKQ